MNSFMGKKVCKVNEELYELVEECICNKDDIRYFNEYAIGVLQRPISEDKIYVRYFIIGFPERYKLMDYLENGVITETGLRYMENPWSDSITGGIEYIKDCL